eukprot:gene21411-28369_t
MEEDVSKGGAGEGVEDEGDKGGAGGGREVDRALGEVSDFEVLTSTLTPAGLEAARPRGGGGGMEEGVAKGGAGRGVEDEGDKGGAGGGREVDRALGEVSDFEVLTSTLTPAGLEAARPRGGGGGMEEGVAKGGAGRGVEDEGDKGGAGGGREVDRALGEVSDFEVLTSTLTPAGLEAARTRGGGGGIEEDVSKGGAGGPVEDEGDKGGAGGGREVDRALGEFSDFEVLTSTPRPTGLEAARPRGGGGGMEEDVPKGGAGGGVEDEGDKGGAGGGQQVERFRDDDLDCLRSALILAGLAPAWPRGRGDGGMGDVPEGKGADGLEAVRSTTNNGEVVDLRLGDLEPLLGGLEATGLNEGGGGGSADAAKGGAGEGPEAGRSTTRDGEVVDLRLGDLEPLLGGLEATGLNEGGGGGSTDAAKGGAGEGEEAGRSTTGNELSTEGRGGEEAWIAQAAVLEVSGLLVATKERVATPSGNTTSLAMASCLLPGDGTLKKKWLTSYRTPGWELQESATAM